MAREKLIHDPEFIDQLKEIGMSDRSIQDVTFSYADHQYLVRLMGVRDDAVKGDINTLIKDTFKTETDQLCVSLAEIISAQNRKLNSSLDDQDLNIQKILLKLDAVADDIIKIKQRLTNTEGKVSIEEKRIEDHEKRLIAKNNRIKKLELEMLILQPQAIKKYTDDLRDLKPVLDEVNASLKWWKWWKIALLLGSLTGLWFLIHYLFLM